jgi:hypothetical protein
MDPDAVLNRMRAGAFTNIRFRDAASLSRALGFQLERQLLRLEACSAFGRTAEEAVAEATRAKEAWLETAREAGKPIPEPRYRPAPLSR